MFHVVSGPRLRQQKHRTRLVATKMHGCTFVVSDMSKTGKRSWDQATHAWRKYEALTEGVGKRKKEVEVRPVAMLS